MRKTAVAIGNAAYPESPLSNPANDAIDVATRLEELGFAVRLHTDATVVEMQEAVEGLAQDLSRAEVGLFYFAGHGMQIDGSNYLTAVDTGFDTEGRAKYSSLPLNYVIDVLEKGSNQTSIIVLDACRNNPYERRWRNVDSAGLASVYAPKGTIIAFSTSPGQVARDGVERNGAFTGALLRHLGAEDLAIEDLFKRVRNSLSAATSGRQISWEHTSLMGDFFFNPRGLTGGLETAYSEEAKADSLFQFVEGRPLTAVLRGLKSHDWYEQKPAMFQLPNVAIETATRDELLVLGRNIYQAACGSSNPAESFVEHLATRLQGMGTEVGFHVLNGILYEIYFDSNGRFRRSRKAEHFDDVFLLEGGDDFSSSFEFIAQALAPYQAQLFYLPASGRGVAIDVVIDPQEDGESSAVKGILFDGQDVLYASDGETLVTNTEDDFRYSMRKLDFEKSLVSDLTVPMRRLGVTYSRQISDDDELILPYGYIVQRLSL